METESRSRFAKDAAVAIALHIRGNMRNGVTKIAVLFVFLVLFVFGCSSQKPEVFSATEQEMVLAARRGELAVVKSAIERGANVNVHADDGGTTALHSAAASGHLATVEFLVSAGADMYAEDFNGNTPVHSAAQNGRTAIVEWFLSNGVPVDIGRDAATPLGFAVELRQLETARFLISRGANVNARDLDGYSVLHAAVLVGDPNIVKLLLDHGANPKRRGIFYETPAKEAEKHGRKDLAAMLRQCGG